MRGTLFGVTIRDRRKRPVPAASVSIFNANDGTLATVYEDADLTVEHDNPFTTDRKGKFQIHLAGGNYHLVAQRWGDPLYERRFSIGGLWSEDDGLLSTASGERVEIAAEITAAPAMSVRSTGSGDVTAPISEVVAAETGGSHTGPLQKWSVGAQDKWTFNRGGNVLGISADGDSLHIGHLGDATGDAQSVSIGPKAKAGKDGTAVGHLATTVDVSNTVVGDRATGLSASATAIGQRSWAGRESTSLGSSASRNRRQDFAVIIGSGAGPQDVVANNQLDKRFILHQDAVNAVPLLHGMFDALRLGIGLGYADPPTAPLDVGGDRVRVRSSHTPATATAAGQPGEIAWDAEHIYVCIAVDTWRRVAHASW